MSVTSYKEYKKGDPLDKYIRILSGVESTNDASAVSGAGAAGLYQFMPKTWNEYVKKMGLNYTMDDRFDPEKSRIVLKRFTKDNRNYFKKKFGRDPNMTELYMTHFMGMGGGVKFIKALEDSPYATADTLYSDRVLKDNKHVFFDKDGYKKPLIEIYNNFAKKFGEKEISTEPILSDDFDEDTRGDVSVNSKNLNNNTFDDLSKDNLSTNAKINKIDMPSFDDFFKKSMETQQQKIERRNKEFKMLQSLIRSGWGKAKSVKL